ncbi:MAG: hypothetical protein EHM35_05060, partial [Planctomycetaceae bacterium]
QSSYINYTTEAEERFLSAVVFEYGDRPDPFSDYRAGFEIRTRQRCEKIETWTRADQDRLVRSYNLVYLDQSNDPEQSLPLNGVSLLHQISATGHDKDATEALAPVEFGYSRFQPQARKFFPVEGELPAVSLASPDLETVDLFGNGLPDILQMNGIVRYWRNLGNGCYDRPRMMQDAPAGLTLADPGVQLLDANGDGQIDLLVTVNGQAGYYPLTFQGTWDRKGFQRYAQAPSFNLEAPDVRLIDLNGDGVTDVVRAGTRFEYFFNDPKTGWNDTRQSVRGDLNQFPNLNFSDPRVKLGDMNGDGLQDIVLVHDGTVEYWPNQGYGRWGARSQMQNSPRFNEHGYSFGYDPSRILVGDVDGDGLADIVYVDNGQVQLWINQSGNSWSDPIVIRGTPQVTDMDAVRLIDLLGTGVSGLLWSRDAHSHGKRQMFFLDFTGGVKPYLLDTLNNHMGATTRVEYKPSTVFYLQDAQRWRTPLPFPVQVVARVEVNDHFSGGRLTTEYRYHDGYWDGEEREFRGFGLVEQFDTEIFQDLEQDHRSPPTLTKTWFHQGPIFDDIEQVWTEADYRDAYWPGDPQLLQRTADQDAFLATLKSQDRRDALRTLRGRVMRSELFALDRVLNQDHTGPEDRPYSVTEYAYGIEEKEAGASVSRKRIFFPHVVAQRTTQWERGEDPLTQIIFTGEYDPFGQPQEQTTIALPRRQLKQQTSPETLARAVLATQTATQYAGAGPNRYICDRVSQSWTFELTEPPQVVERDPENLIQVLADQLEAARLTHSKFRQFRDDWLPGQVSDDFRVIDHTIHYYDGEAFVGLPLGQVGPFGVLVRTESLALDEPILQAAYGDERPPYFTPGDTADWTGYPAPFRDQIRQLRGMAGYTFYEDDGVHQPGFYAMGMRQRYDFQDGVQGTVRGLLRATRDPLGEDGSAGSVRDTVIEYDAFNLLPAKVTTPAGLEIQAQYDYRVLQPREISDPNGNRSLFTFSPLGLLQETWVQGKGENEGDRERASSRMEYAFM